MKHAFSIRRTITCAAAAALCAVMMSPRAFAEDILTDKSIYLENREEITQSWEGWVIDGKTIIPDADTIMPVYGASIYDYAKTGNFKIEPDGQIYFCDALDEDGNYAGTLQLRLENGTFRYSAFGPSIDRSQSISIEVNAKRIRALMKKRGLNTDCKEVRFVLIKGIGSAYYIDNGTEKMLVATPRDQTSPHIFNSKNGGLIIVGDELKSAAEAMIAGEPWSEEVYYPIFAVDNLPYMDGAGNPNTGADDSAETTKRAAVLLVELSVIAAAGIGIKVIGKIRKNGR